MCFFINSIIIYFIKKIERKKYNLVKVKILRHIFFFFMISLLYFIFYLINHFDDVYLRKLKWDIKLDNIYFIENKEINFLSDFYRDINYMYKNNKI